jgi:hypothetical protein
MKNRILIVCLLIIGLNSCGIDEPNQDLNYPTTLYPLNGDMLNKYLNEYMTLNNNRVCTQLNMYGYCEYDLTPCMSRPILRTEIIDESKMIRLAKEFIIKNSKYTGVNNIDNLIISSSDGLSGCVKCDGSANDIKNIKWRLRFSNQYYDGYEVLNTDFFVFLDNNGVFMIGGNWYPKIIIPHNDNYDLKKAKESLYGHKISFRCWNQIEITVNQSNIKQEARKVIIPRKMDDRIELRVTWEIYITDSNNNSMWAIYVDSMTGEIISENQLIIC